MISICTPFEPLKSAGLSFPKHCVAWFRLHFVRQAVFGKENRPERISFQISLAFSTSTTAWRPSQFQPQSFLCGNALDQFSKSSPWKCYWDRNLACWAHAKSSWTLQFWSLSLWSCSAPFAVPLHAISANVSVCSKSKPFKFAELPASFGSIGGSFRNQYRIFLSQVPELSRLQDRFDVLVQAAITSSLFAWLCRFEPVFSDWQKCSFWL